MRAGMQNVSALVYGCPTIALNEIAMANKPSNWKADMSLGSGEDGYKNQE